MRQFHSFPERASIPSAVRANQIWTIGDERDDTSEEERFGADASHADQSSAANGVRFGIPTLFRSAPLALTLMGERLLNTAATLV